MRIVIYVEVLIFFFYPYHLFLAPLTWLLCTDLPLAAVLCKGSGLSLKIIFCSYGSLCRFLLVLHLETQIQKKNKQPLPIFKIS